ncbi:MAG: hypothetical protein JSS02_05580 [Planctomycetes bacterium]|nr:hypothetical protein [Planctomycetota bacterium]
MPKRRWKLKKSQGVELTGPVRIWVSRGVTLVIEADKPVIVLPPKVVDRSADPTPSNSPQRTG